MQLAEACQYIAALGFDGIEIAPFTLGSDPSALDQESRRTISETIRAHGLGFIGLHWLLVGPEGLHATTRDESVRRRTWNYVAQMVDLCADLADPENDHKGVLVFGSPKQRSARDGMSPGEATDTFVQELAQIAPHAESRGVTVLVEALPTNQSDVITSLAEAVSIVKHIGSSAVQTMFDVHNAIEETAPHAELIRKFAPYIRHVHVNELDGREPGRGDYDFAPIFKTLVDIHYRGWVSVEAFDFTRDPVDIARTSINTLKAAEQMQIASEPLI